VFIHGFVRRGKTAGITIGINTPACKANGGLAECLGKKSTRKVDPTRHGNYWLPALENVTFCCGNGRTAAVTDWPDVHSTSSNTSSAAVAGTGGGLLINYGTIVNEGSLDGAIRIAGAGGLGQSSIPGSFRAISSASNWASPALLQTPGHDSGSR